MTALTREQRREELVRQMSKCINKAGWTEHEPDCENCRKLVDAYFATKEAETE